MLFVDSHCHLNMISYNDEIKNLSQVIQLAQDAKLCHLLSVSVVLDDLKNLLAIAEEYPQVSVSAGVHPTEEVSVEPSIEDLLLAAQHPKVVAIGETGLDYYHPGFRKQQQQERFLRHIEVAKKLDRPLIIHTRAAQADTLALMKNAQASLAGGVMHCFTEDWEMAKQALDLNFYISISGIVTFRAAEQVAEVARRVPLDRLLIETDAPFLAPVPHRGKPNYPHYVVKVAEKIAELRGIRVEELAAATTANFFHLFKLNPPCKI